MNKWQQKYVDEYFKGKAPKSKSGKQDMQLLGFVKEYVVVELPNGNVKEYKIVLEDGDMTKGEMDVRGLISNLNLWLSRNYTVRTR